MGKAYQRTVAFFIIAKLLKLNAGYSAPALTAIERADIFDYLGKAKRARLKARPSHMGSKAYVRKILDRINGIIRRKRLKRINVTPKGADPPFFYCPCHLCLIGNGTPCGVIQDNAGLHK
jgi:hypothetical protein